MRVNEASGLIVDTAVKMHQHLGPGLLESVYQRVLLHELGRLGLDVVCEKTIPIRYGDVIFEEAFRADLIVNDTIILEIKSVETVTAVHRKQVLTYLRLANKPLGLLLNFGAALMKDGIERIVNGLDEQ